MCGVHGRDPRRGKVRITGARRGGSQRRSARRRFAIRAWPWCAAATAAIAACDVAVPRAGSARLARAPRRRNRVACSVDTRIDHDDAASRETT
jgi:hypothetical protein